MPVFKFEFARRILKLFLLLLLIVTNKLDVVAEFSIVQMCLCSHFWNISKYPSFVMHLTEDDHTNGRNM
jgi:hypothetical protein